MKRAYLAAAVLALSTIPALAGGGSGGEGYGPELVRAVSRLAEKLWALFN
jgi:hypothetical protein